MEVKSTKTQESDIFPTGYSTLTDEENDPTPLTDFIVVIILHSSDCWSGSDGWCLSLSKDCKQSGATR